MPKVLLHDHLDGGLRPATVVELAREYGYTHLPTTDVARAGDLVQPRRQAQRPRALPRDVRAHRRRDAAPRRHRAGRRRVRRGPRRRRRRLRRGAHGARAVHRAGPHARRGGRGHPRRASPRARPGTPLTIYADLLRPCAPRRAARRSPSWPCATATRGVVGFDIAGAEAGYPPTAHLDAFQYVQRENFHTTIHAGEAFGLPSIWEAVQFCGAERLGHGVRIVDDISGAPGDEQLGRLAAFVRDRVHPARAVPDLQRRHRRVRVDRRAPDRHAPPAALPGHGQHRQPADERHLDVARSSRNWPTRSAGAWDDFEWLTINADEERVRAVPRAAAHHQRARQAA